MPVEPGRQCHPWETNPQQRTAQARSHPTRTSRGGKAAQGEHLTLATLERSRGGKQGRDELVIVWLYIHTELTKQIEGGVGVGGIKTSLALPTVDY